MGLFESISGCKQWPKMSAHTSLFLFLMSWLIQHKLCLWELDTNAGVITIYFMDDVFCDFLFASSEEGLTLKQEFVLFFLER